MPLSYGSKMLIIVLPIGAQKQTLSTPGMTYNQKISEKDFPLWVVVKPQGQVELMPTPGVEMKWTQINRHGNYHFTVEVRY